MALDPALIEGPYPFQTLIGFEMRDWGPDFSCFTLPITPQLGNRYGIVHGGVHAVMLDTVMGFAGCHTGDPSVKQMAMTLSLTTNFIGQAQGQTLIAEGRRIGGGHKTYFAEGLIRCDAGVLVASGTGVFRYRGR